MTDSSLAPPHRSRLNYCWRLVMTAVSFTLFSVGGLLLSLFWFNLIPLFAHAPLQRRRLARRSIAFSFRCFLRFCDRMGIYSYHFEGLEQLRADRGCLIVANHPSLIDYVLIASQLPDVDCLVKADLRKDPFLGGVIRAANYLLNSEAGTLLPESQQRLAQGDCILIFPEGTRTRYGEPLKLQRGAANIAVRAGCELRVVHITCDQRMLDKQSRWYQIPPAKPHFTVRVRSRIPCRQDEDAKPLAARRLTRELQQALTPDTTCDV